MQVHAVPNLAAGPHEVSRVNLHISDASLGKADVGTRLHNAYCTAAISPLRNKGQRRVDYYVQCQQRLRQTFSAEA